MKLGKLTKYAFVRRLTTILTFFAVCIIVLVTDRNYNRKDFCQEYEIQDAAVLNRMVKADFPEISSAKQHFQHFDVNEEIMNPLPIPYKYMLGYRPSSKRFLSIGISSIKRKSHNYLIDTIKTIFSVSNARELEEMLLVVYLANTDPSDNKETAKQIGEIFRPQVDAGNLIVICSSMKNYPTLEGLKRNFDDPEEKVKFRSKQNVDYAFLANFCAPLSEYYLMLEDDVVCAANFLTGIKKSFQNIDISWTTISYSKLGYLGKLFHAEDLPKLARFLLMFYDEMPGDWLLEQFYKSKTQKEMIHVTPTLFQHVGSLSSFQSLKIKPMQPEVPEVSTNKANKDALPPASCFTTLEVHEQYEPGHICSSSGQFFWGKNVQAGSTFIVVFKSPINISNISIDTGSPEHPDDILHSGHVQFGRMKTMESNTCQMYNNLGPFNKGRFELTNMDQVTGHRVECIKILVTAPQNEWLIIRYVKF
ncbi:alpha-1,6-mannosyl-glycoprotein 4-beta-N-acetylglucosaminyltransferase-like [Lissotriton helveticus]